MCLFFIILGFILNKMPKKQTKKLEVAKMVNQLFKEKQIDWYI